MATVRQKTVAGKKLWPVPEILEGERPFTLRETTKRDAMVCTDLVGKTMYVPTTDDAYGRMGRMHEMAHVAITPTNGMQIAQERGIDPKYMNVAEDMRVHHFLERKFELKASIPEDMFRHTIEGYVLKEDYEAAVLMAVACFRMPEYDTLMDILVSKMYEWYSDIQGVIDYCNGILLYDGTTFEQAMQIAEYLQRKFDPIAKELDKAVEEDGMPEDVAYMLKGNEYRNADVDWGVMEIKRPALTERMAERRLNRRIKPQEMGSSLMFPSRLDVDDKIFGNMKRVSKGTVLIDVSGSMYMSAEDIRQMVHSTPGVTVACYSGNHDGTGHLTIVAAKGAMMKLTSSKHWPSANEVDGPALKWLARQAEPRIWVCDGQVTGAGDNFSAKLTLEAYKIAKDYSIRRVGHIKEVPNSLKK